ncbi:prenyltransferase and squalene oxidase repeat-containing domain protein, partial [Cooperia oncophora]
MSFAGFLDIARKDVDIPSSAPKELLPNVHAEFITNFEKKKDFLSSTFMRKNLYDEAGIYCQTLWITMQLLSTSDSASDLTVGLRLPRIHDSHLLHTLSAVQILIMFDSLDKFDLDAIAEYVRQLQNEDGSFGGDVSNEVDTRFSFCAVATLFLIDRMHVIDLDKAVRYVLSCYNFDGGFGTRPGSESHAGQ